MSVKKEKDKAVPVSFKFPPEVKELLKKLAEKNIRSQAGMLEVLIRDAAKNSGIEPGK